MTLAQAGEIFRYWEHNPPAYLIVQTIARLLGWAPPDLSNVRSMIAAIATAPPPPGLAVIRGSSSLGMPPPLLDPAALRARNRARALQIARRNPAATYQ
jgi:hypothetical protein